jgi:phosphoribosylformimino-5-aminoimidazole carboxamide ribonucleotide (ProFAR) isomerase
MVRVLPSEGELAVVVAEGDLDVDDLITAYGDYLRSDAARLTLLDLSGASLSQIDAVTLRTVAQRVAELGKGVRSKKARSAVLARPVDYDLIRMLTTYLIVEGHPVRVAAFTNRDEAKAWLVGDDAE